MGVVQAKIQTVEDIYRLVWSAVASRRPVEAMYPTGFLGCFAPTDWAGISKGSFVCSVTSTAGKAAADSSPQVRPQTGAAWH